MSIQVIDVVEPVACRCGSVRWEMGGTAFPFVRCSNCGKTGPNADTKMGAVRAWNAEYGVKPTATPTPAFEGIEMDDELKRCPSCGGEAERFGCHAYGCDRCSRYKPTARQWNSFAMEHQHENPKPPAGGVRSSDADHVRYDLVSVAGLKRLAETYAEGAAKYGVDNWRKGFKFSDLLNHLMRHIEMFRDGDAGEDHLAHAAWGLFTLMDHEENLPEMDDRWKGGDAV